MKTLSFPIGVQLWLDISSYSTTIEIKFAGEMLLTRCFGDQLGAKCLLMSITAENYPLKADLLELTNSFV